MIPDGEGGWYIGGSFSKIGNATRNRLARINTDGSQHAWNPGVEGTVYALAISGNTIFAGGDFTNIGGQYKYHIAAINAKTGLPSGE